MTAAVQSLLTVGSSKGWGAAADVATSDFLLACASIKAGVVCACHGDDLTVFPVESLRTCAGVIVLQILQKKKKIIY